MGNSIPSSDSGTFWAVTAVLGLIGGFAQALLQGNFNLPGVVPEAGGRKSIYMGSIVHLILGVIAATVYLAVFPPDTWPEMVANGILAGISGGSVLARYALSVERHKAEAMAHEVTQSVTEHRAEEVARRGQSSKER